MATFNASALSTYIDQTGELIQGAVAGARTASIVRIIPGIKSSKDVHPLTSSVLGHASACAWTVSGSTTLGKVNVSVCPIMFTEEICEDVLEGYFTQLQMKPGSYNTTVGADLEQQFTELKTKDVGAANELIYWQGNTSTGSGNLGLCNGWIQKLRNTSYSATTYTAITATAITVTNAMESVDIIYQNMNPKVYGEKDLVLFMSEQNFLIYMAEIRNKNFVNPNYYADGGSPWSFPHPGAPNLTVYGVTGLNAVLGTGSFSATTGNVMIATPAQNFVIGTDLENDYEQSKLWYDTSNLITKFLAKEKIGVEIIFASYVTTWGI